ncbi:MAG TPA: carboxylating nicotinate-nucleotide diphosphorylase [Melioribacteraceae bacterium]|nr:carboxylating nicotinate-nucleotide diphosphorylase [Melioribacteraceae bacterium]
MFNNININLEEVRPLIKMALEEDLRDGDITTDAIVTENKKATMTFLLKEDGVIAGLPLLYLVTDYLISRVEIACFVKDGQFLPSGTIVAKITGPVSLLLKAERTILNFMQRLSGIATKTNRYVSILAPYTTKILDTRKTVPGHRLLDKYAVRIGGGCNHRFGLYDMVMIKDNHIKVIGGISVALDNIKDLKDKYPFTKIEIEVKNIDGDELATKLTDWLKMKLYTKPGCAYLVLCDFGLCFTFTKEGHK